MSEYIMLSYNAKLDALFSAIEKIDGILEDLHASVFMHMPLCRDFDEQQKLDKIFWYSIGMDGILELDSSLRNAKECALNTVHQLEHSTPAEVAY